MLLPSTIKITYLWKTTGQGNSNQTFHFSFNAKRNEVWWNCWRQMGRPNNKPINHQQKANVFALLCWLMVVLLWWPPLKKIENLFALLLRQFAPFIEWIQWTAAQVGSAWVSFAPFPFLFKKSMGSIQPLYSATSSPRNQFHVFVHSSQKHSIMITR